MNTKDTTHIVRRWYNQLNEEKECEYCGGEGVIITDEYEPVGGHKQHEQKCICQIQQ